MNCSIVHQQPAPPHNKPFPHPGSPSPPPLLSSVHLILEDVESCKKWIKQMKKVGFRHHASSSPNSTLYPPSQHSIPLSTLHPPSQHSPSSQHSPLALFSLPPLPLSPQLHTCLSLSPPLLFSIPLPPSFYTPFLPPLASSLPPSPASSGTLPAHFSCLPWAPPYPLLLPTLDPSLPPSPASPGTLPSPFLRTIPFIHQAHIRS